MALNYKLQQEFTINGTPIKIEEFPEWKSINSLLEEETKEFKEAGIDYNIFAIPTVLHNGNPIAGKFYNTMYLEVTVYNYATREASLRYIKTYSAILKEYLTTDIVRTKELKNALNRVIDRLKFDLNNKRLYAEFYGRADIRN